ncbi:MAG: Rap1a/Tai family immunity protein [Acidobacteriota bacterium]|nr:Rap1a/Tai family immunity protein [Acidobacteriota bacterium]
MTRSILCVLALVFVATAGRAAAQLPTPNVDDGNALLRECGAALRAADGGPVIESNPVARGMQMGQCLGLVSAVWHTHEMMVETFDSRTAFCPSASISAGQMARVVHAFLTLHPDDLGRWDAELILQAFADAYPCNSR